MVANREEDRLLETIRQLRSDLEDMRRGGYIPRLDDDPPVESGITLWMLHDGRLRGRLRDGTVQEWAKSNHTHPGVASGPVNNDPTSQVPPPPPQYVPSQWEFIFDADWSQAYWHGGMEQYANAQNRLYYGRQNASVGELKSMIHFPNLKTVLAPGSAGTRIIEVWLRLSNIHTYPNAGTELSLGLHNSDTKPGSFAETARAPYRIRVGKPSPDVWYRLPEEIGDLARDDKIKGITLNQASTNVAFYGYASGVGGPLSPPQLKIIAVK